MTFLGHAIFLNLIIVCFIFLKSKQIYAESFLGTKKEQFDALFEEGKKHVEDAPYKAIELLEQALRIADFSNDSLLIQLYKNLSNAYCNTSNYEKAFLYLSIAKDTALNKRDSLQFGWLSYETGLLYYSIQDYQEAIKQFEQTYRIAKQQKNKVLEGASLTQIGVQYRYLKDYWRSLRYLNLAEAIHLQNRDTLSIIGNYHNKALLFTYFYKLDSALYYFRQNICLSQQIKNHNLLLASITRLGTAFEHAQQYDSAMYYYQKAIEMYNQKESTLRWITDSYQSMARIHLKKRQTSSARYYAQEAEKFSHIISDKTYLTNTYYLLSECYDSARDFKKSLFYLKLADSMRNKLLDYKRLQYISSLNYKYETVKKQNEIIKERLALEEAQHKTQKQKNDVLLLVTLTLIFTVASVWILVMRKNRITAQLNLRNKQISEMNKKLQEMNLEKNNLISVVAHDIRAPFQRIKGLLNIIHMTGQNLNNEQIELLKQAIKIAEQSTEMVTELLDISSLEAKTEDIDFQVVDLTAILFELIEIYKEQAQSKGITLLHDLPQKKIEIMGNANYVKRIFDNLISNAIKFSFPNGKVTISLVKDTEWITVHVIDEGQGIAPEEKELLFQKFKRLSAKPTAGENSTGLGLAIVKQLADKLHAKIEVESQVGKGSDFAVIFSTQRA